MLETLVENTKNFFSDLFGGTEDPEEKAQERRKHHQKLHERVMDRMTRRDATRRRMRRLIEGPADDGVRGTHRHPKYRHLQNLEQRLEEARRMKANARGPRRKEFSRLCVNLEGRVDRQTALIQEAERTGQPPRVKA